MPTLPKQERPAREGARVASVETGLAAAAAKLAQQVRTEEESVVASVITILLNLLMRTVQRNTD